MTTNAASPARNEGAPQNRPPQGETAAPGENWQQQVEELLQPTLASLRQQVAQAAEQQLEPLRSRMQQLAEQQQNGKAHRQTSDSSSQSLVPAAAEAPAQQASEGESTLQRWGETLEGAALMILALGEMLEGLAMLMQALGLVVGGKPSSQQEEPSPQEEEESEVKEDEPSPPEEREEPSLVQKVGDTVSGGASSVKQAVSHAADSSSPALHGLEGVLASLPQWARILEHASALVQALGDSASSQQDGLKKWQPILKHGAPLVKELSQVLGGSSLQQGGYGGSNAQRWGRMIGRAASALETLGDGSSQKQDDGKSSAQERESDSSSNQEQEKGSSVKEKLGGVTSTLKDLAGGSSSEKKDDEGGSSLLDALTGEGSPLQTLREFSKRQQGPGGLAPKGPVGRKPPPGPLRRDRIPKEE